MFFEWVPNPNNPSNHRKTKCPSFWNMHMCTCAQYFPLGHPSTWISPSRLSFLQPRLLQGSQQLAAHFGLLLFPEKNMKIKDVFKVKSTWSRRSFFQEMFGVVSWWCHSPGVVVGLGLSHWRCSEWQKDAKEEKVKRKHDFGCSDALSWKCDTELSFYTHTWETDLPVIIQSFFFTDSQ